MAELKTYPEYKGSGVEWIGKIPVGWKVIALKYISNIVMGQSPDSSSVNNQLKGLPFLQGNAEFTALYPKPKHYSSDFKKVTNKDDILFSVRAPVGAMNWSDNKYIIGRGLCAISSKDNCFINYLWYLLQCLRIELFSKMTGSTFEAVTISDVRESNALLPNIIEQKNISYFLEQKTSQIDALISDKERLIELLEEKRQAVITETVTKGLDPNVKMKDSGIEWIGEIPEHWEIGKVGYVYEITLGKMIQPQLKNQDDQLVPYLKANNIQDGYISYSNVDTMYASLREVKKYELSFNDLLVCEGGDVARSAFVEKELEYHIFQNALHRVRGKNKGSVRFLHYLLNTIRNTGYIELLVNRATIAHFTKDKFSSLKIPIPPISEQKEVESFIYNTETKINRTIKEIELQIFKLKEYRESLIYEAVTGKIDVRDYVAETEEVY